MAPGRMEVANCSLTFLCVLPSIIMSPFSFHLFSNYFSRITIMPKKKKRIIVLLGPWTWVLSWHFVWVGICFRTVLLFDRSLWTLSSDIPKLKLLCACVIRLYKSTQQDKLPKTESTDQKEFIKTRHGLDHWMEELHFI